VGVVFIAEDADGAKAEASLAPEPWGEAGDAVAGADEEGVLLANLAEGDADEDAREGGVCPEEDDVEIRDEAEKEDAGDVAGVLGDEEEEEEAADRPDSLAEDDGKMLEDGAVVEGFAEAAGAEEIARKEAGDEGEAVGAVAGGIEIAIGGGDMRENEEPRPEQEDDRRSLKGDEEGFNAADALGDH
jgi:hypothetical protein